MMEKNMLVLYGSPRERGFTKELLKNIYTGMGECLSEYKHLYIPCISRKYGTVYCLWFLSTKRGMQHS